MSPKVTADSNQSSCVVEILNQRGLHARAAAKFVKTAGAFEASIDVSRQGQTVSGHSIMGLMMLAASTGCEIEISCSGKDAGAAMEALVELIANKFEED
ncbi:MAG: HPr family phosphocarrier protein [Rhodospirillales bacterium]|nr:HPr family phosphocarrier protein [Rhodospirillales bacterium]